MPLHVPSVFDAPTRDALRRRLRALRPDAPARWGRLTAPTMVAHLVDSMRLTLGDSAAAPMAGRESFRRPLTRWLIITLLPWPRGRVTGPPEAFVTAPSTWAADVAELEALLERFGASGDREAWPPHPAFGSLSRRLWDRFTWRHTDHHLRQFGV